MPVAYLVIPHFTFRYATPHGSVVSTGCNDHGTWVRDYPFPVGVAFTPHAQFWTCPATLHYGYYAMVLPPLPLHTVTFCVAFGYILACIPHTTATYSGLCPDYYLYLPLRSLHVVYLVRIAYWFKMAPAGLLPHLRTPACATRQRHVWFVLPAQDLPLGMTPAAVYRLLVSCLAYTFLRLGYSVGSTVSGSPLPFAYGRLRSTTGLFPDAVYHHPTVLHYTFG